MNLHWRWFCGEWRKLYNVGEKNANWFKCFWFYKSSRLYLMSDWSTMWTSKEVETIHKMYNLLCVQKICMDPISYLFSRDLQVCDVEMGGIRHLDILKYKLNNIYLICKIWLSFSNIQNLQYLTPTAIYLIILVVVIQRSSWRIRIAIWLWILYDNGPRSHKSQTRSLSISVSLLQKEYIVQKWDWDQK